MKGLGETFKSIEIFSTFEELERVVDEVEAFCASCFSNEDKVYTGVLLASEAITNAIEHGNALDATKTVLIEFKSTLKAVEIWVEDQGPGFDRSKVADPLDAEHLLADGGRGVFLIEKLADEVKYEKEGRRVGIIFNR
ncbi:MAG: ATP-binding protein [Bacteroidetes bacterium]|nr:ATP-binding protein [Bacteroidota bacterium]